MGNESETTMTTPAVENCYDYNSHKCDKCGGMFIVVRPKYCPHCGRKIIKRNVTQI